MKYLKFYDKKILLKESLNNEIENKLKKISNYIKKRFKEKYNSLFVYWISKIFKVDKISFISKIELSEDIKDVKHVYINFDNIFYDEKGFYDKNEIMEKHNLTEYNFKDLVFDSGVKKLKTLIDKEKIEISNKSLDELKIMIQKIKDS